MPFRADGTADPGDALECWTVLAAVGAALPRLRLVSMVSPVSIHHPVLLAKRAITTDHVSGGRAVLGLGAGWQENEHSSFGFQLLDAGPRVTRFAEAIEIIHRLRTEDAVSFHGSYYDIADAPCSPKPVGSLPLLVGTASPRMLRLTARFADEWNTWGAPDENVRRTELFFAACEAEGRDPASVYRSAQALVSLGEADPTAPAGRTISGSDQQIIDELNRYAESGVDEFAFLDDPLGETREQRFDGIAHIRELIIPHVQ
jgi:alkanesulfonate monooxygenase SsuD/methylene tetrahydromethanopterin reductase-like flavin-dependent oxidoreductase (luciferase family)